MPANLTPEYEKAELRYREAVSDEARLAALQEMLGAIPKHKGTEKMQADLKRRLSALRKTQQESSHSKGPDPFHIPKSGAGQVVIIGPPNVGKSSLLAATTHAGPKVAEYRFTTTVPLPGMWQHDDVQIELVDTPALTPEHIVPGLLGTIHGADVIGVMVEAGDSALEQTDTVLGILDERGLRLRSALGQALQPGDARECPGLIIANKTDVASPGSLEALRSLYSSTGGQARLDVVAISTRLRLGLDELFHSLWDLLGRIRVYAKEPGQPPDLAKPFVLPRGATVADLALQIHRDLPERMKFARLWGHSRFEGQQVHKTEVLQDRDAVEIHE
jgi:ribosome-interacting GTPase 1